MTVFSITALLARACTRAPRNMTWAEWQRYMDGPYQPTCAGAPVPPDVVEELTIQGVELVQAGAVITAITPLSNVLVLPPVSAPNPEAAAYHHLSPALAQDGQIEAALTAMETAQTLEPEIEVSAKDWNALCRQGSLWDYATEVMNTCEQAVELAPENAGIRDSRGLARALIGDYAGAIEDFEFYVQQEKDWDGSRQAWLEALQAGRNPFDEETLESLRNE